MAIASSWPAVPAMKGHKSYAGTPLGQVHVRDLGQGPAVLLLHQTPWFSVQYALIQPLLAEAGIRAITIDTPGYGLSDLPSNPPKIENYADNITAVLDHLGLASVVICGHHTGALIAAAFAHRHAARTKGAILHGIPLYTADERTTRLAAPHWSQEPKRDGSHLSERFAMIRDRIAAPGATLEGIHWSVMSFFIAGPLEWYGHHAAFTYDAAPAIREMKPKTLLISNVEDMLHPMTPRVTATRPDFEYKEMPGNAHALTDQPEAWVSVAAPFIRRVSA
ncbi:MAG: alpha/beta hydrolase [Alphaproteobacteria bacterium]|nr:alpha/beta hydrolase [Alphaproteobacteria bacterium]